MNALDRTVAAVSTPRGKGGIAVIRISGPEARDVAGAMFQPKRDMPEFPERRAVFGTILDDRGDPCDEGIAVFFRGPRSFTGEDVVEISCHGGPAVTEAVFLSALAHGASAAGPGEFTRRAFVNGKLSLTEAEAVGLLIDADTSERLALSAGALRGNVSREIGRISDSLLSSVTALWAAIDYPEEDVGDEGEREIAGTLEAALRDVEALLGTYRTGRAVASGVRCVVCGRPNVGKSSLFNRILGEDAAIVTERAGTTRDVLRETASFGGVTLRLSDTAGLRPSGDEVEAIGVRRAEREIGEAELILAVFDGSEALTAEDGALLERLRGADAPIIAVVNKTDREPALTRDDWGRIAEICGKPVCVSAAEGKLSELSGRIAELFGAGGIDLRGDAVIWDARHRQALEHGRAALRDALDALGRGDPVDCVCTLAEQGLAALNETDGRGIDERIVNEIFQRFCVGK